MKLSIDMNEIVFCESRYLEVMPALVETLANVKGPRIALVGSPSEGASMFARRIAQAYTMANRGDESSPLRAPHYTISSLGLFGRVYDGVYSKGELVLAAEANGAILFDNFEAFNPSIQAIMVNPNMRSILTNSGIAPLTMFKFEVDEEADRARIVQKATLLKDGGGVDLVIDVGGLIDVSYRALTTGQPSYGKAVTISTANMVKAILGARS